MRFFPLLAVSILLAAHVRGADPAAAKAELFLLLPEPRVMKSSLSKPLAGARNTVFTPAHSSAGAKEVIAYSPAEFGKLGVGWDTFEERAEAAADQMLATRQPELVQDRAGHVQYAMYRAEEPVIACLLVAPALSQVFKKVFGDEIWLITPDRHSLYVFPAKPEALADFAEVLRQRYQDAGFAASEEIFLRKSGTKLQAVGSLSKS
jgi:hypothetical protein